MIARSIIGTVRRVRSTDRSTVKRVFSAIRRPDASNQAVGAASGYAGSATLLLLRGRLEVIELSTSSDVDEISTVVGPDDDRPPCPWTVQGRQCPTCQEAKLPDLWITVVGGTVRGEAVDLDVDEQVEICPSCDRRLRAWLDVDRVLSLADNR